MTLEDLIFYLLAAFLSGLLLVSMEVDATEHVYIFGDSLSSPTSCEWPLMLQGHFAVHNYAQAGLSTVYMDVPNHLSIVKGSPVVVYIGSNDAGQKVQLKYFRMKYKELLQVIKTRGGKPIAVLLPDFLSVRTGNYNEVIRNVAQQQRVPVIDPGWGPEVTSDGVHPTCGANTYLGAWFLGEILNVSE